MNTDPALAYSADRSLKGKLRRRWARVVNRRPLIGATDGPVISFTFDDAPLSAVGAGADVLEAAGLRGTFYVSLGLDNLDGPMGRYGDMESYRALSRRGHEIACHTHSHLDCGRAGADAIAADADRNREALGAAGLAVASFAYPYGDVSPQAKATLEGRYTSMRGLHPGLIRPGADLNQLPAVGIEGPHGEDTAMRWIGHALHQKAWLILYTHDVRDAPSPWGCTPEALSRLVSAAVQSGARVLPVHAALSTIRAAA